LPVSTTVAVAPAHRALAAITASLLVLAALVTGAVTARPAGASTVEDSFTTRLNDARSARGIPRLVVRPKLVAIARAQAQRMADKDLLYHNPNLTSDVHNWRFVGENVGYGPDAATVHSAFMHSAPHKANILDIDYTRIGIGVVTSNGRVWVAEVFKQPMRSAHASFGRALQFGSTGSAVKAVQRRLGIRPTGRYGRHTRRAVRHYQRSLGWAGSGIVGTKTWNHLF
jgi:uncharacterized protein YkwD